MKILCDIGNTTTTLVFLNNQIKIFKVYSKNLLEFISKYDKAFFYISCVVNDIERDIRKKFKNFKFINYKDLRNFVKVRYDVTNLGSDRILNVFLIKELIGADTVIISLGTTIVLDYIDKNSVYLGGEIFPGFKILSYSLNLFTSKLPLVNFKKFKKINLEDLIGKNTKDCINKGILNFSYSGIKNFIDLLSPKNVVFSGGDAFILYKLFKFDFKIRKFLIKESVILGVAMWCFYNDIISKKEFEKVIKKFSLSNIDIFKKIL